MPRNARDHRCSARGRPYRRLVGSMSALPLRSPLAFYVAAATRAGQGGHGRRGPRQVGRRGSKRGTGGSGLLPVRVPGRGVREPPGGGRPTPRCASDVGSRKRTAFATFPGVVAVALGGRAAWRTPVGRPSPP